MFRLSIIGLVFFLLVSCEMEPKTALAQPVDFDAREYQEALKEEIVVKKAKLKTKATKVEEVQEKEPELSTKPIQPKEKLTYLNEVDSIQYKISYAKGRMDTVKLARKKMVFEFDSEWATQIDMKIITEDSLANIRILEINSPEDSLSGPYSKVAIYQPFRTGIHKVVIAEDLDKGSWGGRFVFEVKLSWPKKKK